MKTLSAFALLFVSVACYSALIKQARIGPTSATLSGANGTGEQLATIAAGAAGVKNCLKSIEASNNGPQPVTLRILDGGTTAYTIVFSSFAFNRRFDDEEMCGTAATAMYIKLSTPTTSLTSTNNLSFTGFTF